jgi:hypothetical protein
VPDEVGCRKPNRTAAWLSERHPRIVETHDKARPRPSDSVAQGDGMWGEPPPTWGLRALLHGAIIGAPKKVARARDPKVCSESLSVVRQTRVRWKRIDPTVASAKPLGSLRRAAFDEQVPGTVNSSFLQGRCRIVHFWNPWYSFPPPPASMLLLLPTPAVSLLDSSPWTVYTPPAAETGADRVPPRRFRGSSRVWEDK